MTLEQLRKRTKITRLIEKLEFAQECTEQKDLPYDAKYQPILLYYNGEFVDSFLTAKLLGDYLGFVPSYIYDHLNGRRSTLFEKGYMFYRKKVGEV